MICIRFKTYYSLVGQFYFVSFLTSVILLDMYYPTAETPLYVTFSSGREDISLSQVAAELLIVNNVGKHVVWGC